MNELSHALEIIQLLYYIITALIESATFVTAIIVLFPRIRCFAYLVIDNNQNKLKFTFINLRNRIVVLDRIIYIEDVNGKSVHTEKYISDIVLVSAGNAVHEYPIPSLNIYKICFKDVEGKRYKVILKGENND